jgi:hypothetical protein
VGGALKGSCVGIAWDLVSLLAPPEYKSKPHVWLLSFIVRLSGSELELPNYVYAIEKSR